MATGVGDPGHLHMCAMAMVPPVPLAWEPLPALPFTFCAFNVSWGKRSWVAAFLLAISSPPS